MTITQAQTLSLYDLEQKFNLTAAPSPLLNLEQLDLPPLSDTDNQALAHIRSNYNNQMRYLPLSEALVKMIVLSPLLDLAGFYGRNFRLVTEEPVEILLQEADELIKGRIDVLVVQEQLWILAIESKRLQIDVMSALPQLLFYLLNAANSQKPPLGLITNGREFVFVQLFRSAESQYSAPQYSASQYSTPQYVCSDALSINRSQEFQITLRMLKSLTEGLK